MEKLCKAYWPPLYAFIRREGYAVAQAQDLTQEFFARLLSKDYLQHLRHQEGKFRSFLLTLLKRFLSDHREWVGAQKRGGDRTLVSLEDMSLEERNLAEPRNEVTPDQLFERRWAHTVFDRAIGRLRDEYAAADRLQLFHELKDLNPGQHGETSYAQIAEKLGVAEGTIKSAIHRLRKRHREILREEIAQTVSAPDEVDAEIRHLLMILGQES